MPAAYILEVAGADNSLSIRASNAIKFVYENADALGLSDFIRGIDGQLGENIIFTLRDYRSVRYAPASAFYNDGDASGVDGYDEIGIFVNETVDSENNFYDYVVSVIHEVVHRRYGSHDYANVAGTFGSLYNSDQTLNITAISELGTVFTSQQAASDEVFTRTREAIVRAVDAGLLTYPDNQSLEGEALKAELFQRDVDRLELAVNRSNIFRQVVAWTFVADSARDLGGGWCCYSAY